MLVHAPLLCLVAEPLAFPEYILFTSGRVFTLAVLVLAHRHPVIHPGVSQHPISTTETAPGIPTS